MTQATAAFTAPLTPPPTVSDAAAGQPEIKARAEHVDFFYGSTQALHDISLDFPEHAVTALIGPSGCGKSTFLRCLNRMNDLIPQTRTTGSITLDGEDINGPDMDVVDLRRRVGMVFQRPNPFPKSIFENVAYGLRVNGIRDEHFIAEKVEESLRRAAIFDEVKDRLHSSALGLSGGQQQRLCIARALAVEPEVLLMDEPASALDPIATQRIEEGIHELKNQLTIIIVTHNMQQAARISDRTAFFYMGRLIECDATDILFTRPGLKQTEDYITAHHPYFGSRRHEEGPPQSCAGFFVRPGCFIPRRRPAEGTRRLCMASPETHLQQLMDDLRSRLLTMAAITREATHDAVAALMEQDRDKAAAVIDGDAALDRMEVELDDSIMQILARAQPVACDLRLLLSGIRLISDLERIGDEAVSVAQRAALMGDFSATADLTWLGALGHRAERTLADAVRAFRDGDAKLALTIRSQQDENTQMAVAGFQHIMRDLQAGNVDAWYALHLILITRALERVCSRAVNVAEHAYFLAEGVNLKHVPLSEAKERHVVGDVSSV